MNTEIFHKDGDELVFSGRWEWNEDAERAFRQAQSHGATSFRCNALPPHRMMRAGGTLTPGVGVKTLRFEIWHDPGRAPDNVALIAEDDVTLAALHEDERRFKAAA